jgi:GAF domain-containing protein
MKASDKQLIDSVFAGDDETSAHLRALDWSATPLGTLEQWPQALRTIVRVVLASGYPMAICWGPDYALLYNDAYRPITGIRHPWALGRGAREVYPEAWDVIGPMYESVMARGQAVNVLSDVQVRLTRNNYLEAGVSIPNWPERPKAATVVPIRLSEHSEALGFLVAGLHPGQAFGDAYRQFVRRVAEQITIGLASARAYEQERQREIENLRASVPSHIIIDNNDIS